MSNGDRKHHGGGFNRPFEQLSGRAASAPPARGGGGRPNQSGHKAERQERSLDEVWQGNYLQNGYFEAANNLRDEFVRRENLEKLVKEMAYARPALTSHQLRRFFQHCRAIESRLLAGHSTWDKERAAFLQIDSAAADAFGKQSQKIPRIFHDFIQRNVAAVRTKEDFIDGFLKHFEALVGFAAQHLKDKERQ